MTMEKFWDLDKVYIVNDDGCEVTGAERCAKVDNEFWFELIDSVWSKHCSVFQVHVKYIQNKIVKLFRVGIIQYSEIIHEMHDLNKFLPPYLKKGYEYDQSYWTIRDK